MEALPEFAEPVPNVTAIVGRTVKLPCVVNNLGQYRVSSSHIHGTKESNYPGSIVFVTIICRLSGNL